MSCSILELSAPYIVVLETARYINNSHVDKTKWRPREICFLSFDHCQQVVTSVSLVVCEDRGRQCQASSVLES